ERVGGGRGEGPGGRARRRRRDGAGTAVTARRRGGSPAGGRPCFRLRRRPPGRGAGTVGLPALLRRGAAPMLAAPLGGGLLRDEAVVRPFAIALPAPVEKRPTLFHRRHDRLALLVRRCRPRSPGRPFAGERA